MTAQTADVGRTIATGVYGAPETFVIDRAGRIPYKHIGAITPDGWKQTLLPLIRKLDGTYQ
jgi:cytochrome c biogenesis protein CcmG/thiol:disulfide interchange protein DsbE